MASCDESAELALATSKEEIAEEVAPEVTNGSGGRAEQEPPIENPKMVRSWCGCVGVKRGIRYKQGQVPEIIGFLLELAFCFGIQAWQKANMDAAPEDFSGGSSAVLVLVCWAILIFFVLVRVAVYLLWKYDSRCFPNSILAGLYMFSSSFQFVPYMFLYYRMYQEWSYKVSTPTVNFSYEFNATQGDYTAACDPFSEAACDAQSRIGDTICCLVSMGSLALPNMYIPVSDAWDVPDLFEVFKWLAVLVVTWFWKDVPFVFMTPSDKDFVNGVWLDILDAVVFGSAYILSDDVQFPAFGIQAVGDAKGRRQEEDHHLVFWLQTTWIVAFSCAILSPVVYLGLGFLDVGDGEEHEETLDDATAAIMSSIRMLDLEDAKKHVDRAVQLQQEAYEQLEEIKQTNQPVYVDDEELGFRNRYGVARLGSKAGYYDVTFQDGLNPTTAEEPLPSISPEFKDPKSKFLPSKYCGVGCCTGWLSSKYLKPDNQADAFERRAAWHDTFRSLLLLELPFLFWRLYFEVFQHGRFTLLAFDNILLLKNVVWSIVDLMKILSCGNEKATCLLFTPIEYITRLVKGTKLASVWIGPAGIFRVFADLTKSRATGKLQADRARLTAQRAWLILEQEKAKHLEADRILHDPAAQMYAGELEKINAKLDRIGTIENFVHL